MTLVLQAQLAMDLRAAAPSERSRVISRYRAMTGKSNSQLYRIAKALGFKSGRKPRADAGKLKCGLKDPQVEYLAGLIYETGRETTGPIMPVWRALEIAEDNGIIEQGQATPETVSRIFRERQLSKKHLKTEDSHSEMRSLHPNHVHGFDVSVCIQYYLKNGKLGIMREAEYNDNKPHNFKKLKTRLLRYVLVDHFSGAFYFRYYDASGESAELLFDFLVHAWGAKPDERLPFRGVSEIMLMDAGSANKSKPILNMLDALGVEFPLGTPHNPRRQGIVEGMHNIIEKTFETGLRIQPAYDVKTLNRWALDYAVWHNFNRVHTRHKMTRTACWLQITREQLRDIPDVSMLQEVYAQPEVERTVSGHYRISFRNEEYLLKHIEGLYRGAKVKVVLKPFAWPTVDVVYKGERYQAEPIALVDGGFSEHAAIIGKEYKATPMTAIQHAKARINDYAYGEDGPSKNAIPYAGTVAFGIHADKLPENLTFMPRQGSEINVGEDVGDRQVPIMDLLVRLSNEAGPLSPEMNERIRSMYGSSISMAEADEVVRQVREGTFGADDESCAAI